MRFAERGNQYAVTERVVGNPCRFDIGHVARGLKCRQIDRTDIAIAIFTARRIERSVYWRERNGGRDAIVAADVVRCARLWGIEWNRRERRVFPTDPGNDAKIGRASCRERV